MLIIRVNGKQVEAPEGVTVLDVCRREGIDIPTMCYLDGHLHFTSCMVCVVKDVLRGRLIPACSAPVTDGMELETDSPEVLEGRSVALELLLSEHVGDCEGPCERVCPAQIRIPAVLRLLADDRREEAGRLFFSSSTKDGLYCLQCDGRCEKPCRRGQIDEPVAIRDLMLYATEGLDRSVRGMSRKKIFNSVIGRLTDEEKALLMQFAEKGPRMSTGGGVNKEEGVREAKRCLHCDCRKPEGCRLRRYAEQYGAQQSHYKGEERKTLSIVRQHPKVVYESGKCIKCGICVKITEAAGERLGLAFMYRGYDTVVGVPFDGLLSEGLTRTAEECVRSCPTGALAYLKGEGA